MPKVKITAYSWGQPGKTGRNLRRRGDVVEVTEEQAARLVKIGAATRVKEKAAKPADPKTPENDPKQSENQGEEETKSPEEKDAQNSVDTGDDVKDSESIPQPKPTATKPTWIKYAVQQGLDAEELEPLTRDQIASKFL